MSSVFEPLHVEFEAWRAAGRRIPFWWRDDDAIEATPELARLLELSDALGVPLHLAVIPAFAKESLSAALEGTDARVLIHGWAHENHAPPTEKKAEYRDHRDMQAIRAELEAGFARISQNFGTRFCPIFVPPWNRISPGVTELLATVGYSGVSVFNPRKSGFETNTHIDPIDWRGTRSCVDPKTLITQTVATLTARRLQETDPDEPLGFLTHHLVHDDAIWEFSAAFLREMLRGPVDLAVIEE